MFHFFSCYEYNPHPQFIFKFVGFVGIMFRHVLLWFVVAFMLMVVLFVFMIVFMPMTTWVKRYERFIWNSMDFYEGMEDNIRGSSMWALFCSKCKVMFRNIDAKCSNTRTPNLMHLNSYFSIWRMRHGSQVDPSLALFANEARRIFQS